MSLKMNVRLTKLKFDRGGFNKTFDQKAEILIRQAAREFVRALFIKIPVYSGFARGSIKFAQGIGGQGNLSAYLNVAIPISPVPKPPKHYFHHGRAIRKLPQNAAQFARFNFTKPNNFYQFSYSNDVLYYALNDFFGSKVSGPWYGTEAGIRAFRRYINENISTKLPVITKFLVPDNIEIK